MNTPTTNLPTFEVVDLKGDLVPWSDIGKHTTGGPRELRIFIVSTDHDNPRFRRMEEVYHPDDNVSKDELIQWAQKLDGDISDYNRLLGDHVIVVGTQTLYTTKK